MAKFMIIDDDGNILRTINLPYEGTLIDISAMPDEEWEVVRERLHTHKVEMADKGKHKIDERGLPTMVKR